MTTKAVRDPKMVRMDGKGCVRLKNLLNSSQWYYVRHDAGGVLSLIPTGVTAPVRKSRNAGPSNG